MRHFILIVLVVLLSSCKSTGLKIGNLDVGKLLHQGAKVWDASTIDEEKEIQLGQNVSSVLLGVRPLHSNRSINLYVNQVGNWLALHSSRPDIPWHFGVIDSDSINAFAAPGGYVFITSALLMQLNSEAELAAVLAHEISHVTASHHLDALKGDTYRTALTEALFVSADAYQANTNRDQRERKYTQWARQVTHLAQELYSNGLDREQELAADEGGIKILARAGYDPYAFLSCLQVIESITPSDASLALFYKTHPTPRERIDNLTNTINAMETLDGKLVQQRFQQVMLGKVSFD